MNVIAEIQRINEVEIERGIVGTPASWHAKYSESAWVYVGNLPHRLTEGDVLCIMSQFGEIEDINLVRDDDTGKSKGFAFVKYEDARSCVLAVDNFCGVKVLGRSIRVDHVEKYRLPKHLLEKEEEGEGDGGGGRKTGVERVGAGHAYQGKELASSFDISKGQDLFAGPPPRIPPSPKREKDDKDCGLSKDEKREAKQKRKEARDLKRKEKEERRERKEEKIRRKRAREMRWKEGHEEDGDSREGEDKRKRREKSGKRPTGGSSSRSHSNHGDDKKGDKRRKYRRRSRSSSPSRSQSKGRNRGDKGGKKKGEESPISRSLSRSRSRSSSRRRS